MSKVADLTCVRVIKETNKHIVEECANSCKLNLRMVITLHLKKEEDIHDFNGIKCSTFDMCTPRLLWIPEHCMHMKIPRFTLAHRGPLYRK